MFTGIVEEIGEVVAARRTDDVLELTVRGPTVSSDARHGDSIAVSGVCLTVTALGAPGAGDGGAFRVELVPETLARTSLAGVGVGTRVNLERAMAVGDRLGGHIVQGHVDGVATLLRRDPEHLSPVAARLAKVPPGHPQGYADCFDAFVADTYAAIDGGDPEGLPTFTDGLRSARLVDAVVRASGNGSWTKV